MGGCRQTYKLFDRTDTAHDCANANAVPPLGISIRLGMCRERVQVCCFQKYRWALGGTEGCEDPCRGAIHRVQSLSLRVQFSMSDSQQCNSYDFSMQCANVISLPDKPQFPRDNFNSMPQCPKMSSTDTQGFTRDDLQRTISPRSEQVLRLFVNPKERGAEKGPGDATSQAGSTAKFLQLY